MFYIELIIPSPVDLLMVTFLSCLFSYKFCYGMHGNSRQSSVKYRTLSFSVIKFVFVQEESPPASQKGRINPIPKSNGSNYCHHQGDIQPYRGESS